MKRLFRLVLPLVLFAASASAQLPRQFYAWWNSPVARDMNLSTAQRRQVRQVVQEYRPHLQDLRGNIQEAENELEAEFNREPINTAQANEAIEKLARARADLTRTLSQMSLKLRSVLTQAQWQELQSRRPMMGGRVP